VAFFGIDEPSDVDLFQLKRLSDGCSHARAAGRVSSLRSSPSHTAFRRRSTCWSGSDGRIFCRFLPSGRSHASNEPMRCIDLQSGNAKKGSQHVWDRSE